jgi:tellurite resistance protein TehA-like permease
MDERIPGVNTMAIAGLVFAFLLPPIGIVMAHIAKSQIRRTQERGRGLAIAALVIGYGLLLTCFCAIPLLLVPL